MNKRKRIVNIIETCWDCPSHRQSRHDKSHWCENEDPERQIHDVANIPDWCPLEDEK